MYSARQRELRERRTHETSQEQYWLSDTAAAFEIEEGLDFEAPTSWSVRLPGRNAA
jgi:hypothetical protein